MLELNELIVMAEAARVGVSSVERDYVMSHVVASIANQPISEHLEFKGGTSLRLCHFMEYRYSADIDLNLTHGVDIAAAMVGKVRLEFSASTDLVGLCKTISAHIL